MCPRCVFMPRLTPALPLDKFHYNSIIHQKIELSVPLQRWTILENPWNQALHSHWKKNESQFYRETQLRDRFMIVLSAATYFTFSCFSYQWHIGRSPPLDCLWLHFSSVPHLGERGRVTMDNPAISLRSHVKTRCLMKQSEELKWPSALLQPDKRGRLRGTVSWCSWY